MICCKASFTCKAQNSPNSFNLLALHRKGELCTCNGHPFIFTITSWFMMWNHSFAKSIAIAYFNINIKRSFSLSTEVRNTDSKSKYLKSVQSVFRSTTHSMACLKIITSRHFFFALFHVLLKPKIADDHAKPNSLAGVE